MPVPPPQAPTYDPCGISFLAPSPCRQCPSFRCLARFMSCSSSPVWHSRRRHRLCGQTAEAVSLRLCPKGSSLTYCPCLLLPPLGLGLPRVSALPDRGLLRQEGSPWRTQPFLRASGAGAAGSRAAAALPVTFRAQPVGGLAQGREGMGEGYRALPPSFPLQGWGEQPAHPVSAGHLFVSLLQHVTRVESCAWPGQWLRWSPLYFPNAD